jgi:hypothetical protein
VTTISPFIFPCPMPQNLAHLNAKVPAFDGVNFTVAG